MILKMNLFLSANKIIRVTLKKTDVILKKKLKKTDVILNLEAKQ